MGTKTVTTTAPAVTKGVANLNKGATYTLPTNGQATGASIAAFIQNNAAGSLACVTVQPTAFAKSLGLTPANFKTNPCGMFSSKATTRCHQLMCYLFGVQPATIVANKRKAFKAMQLCTVGGKGASNNLGHIVAAVKASGGKAVTGTIANGNTLAMLLSGTNSLANKHAFYGKPLVQLTVTPTVTTK